MPKVTYIGTTYDCATAVRGSNYIHLLDADNRMLVAFNNITDFTYFSISDGDWTVPTPASECQILVVDCDGTVKPSGKAMCDIAEGWRYIEILPYVLGSGTTPRYGMSDINNKTFTLETPIDLRNNRLWEVCIEVYSMHSGTDLPLDILFLDSTVSDAIYPHSVARTTVSDSSDSILNVGYSRLRQDTLYMRSSLGVWCKRDGYKNGTMEHDETVSASYIIPENTVIDKIKLLKGNNIHMYSSGIILKYRELKI